MALRHAAAPPDDPAHVAACGCHLDHDVFRALLDNIEAHRLRFGDDL